MPIGLTPIATTCRVRPFAGIQRGVGWRPKAARDAEEGSERVKRIESAIEPERERVEVGLKMLGADAVMDAVQPRLQVREDEMANRQEFRGHLWIAAFGNRVMIISPLAQAGISAPVIGDDQSAGYDGSLNKSDQRCGAAVAGDGQADVTGIPTTLSVILRRSRLSVANLDGGRDQRLVVNTSPFATRPAPNVGFVHLDMLIRAPADPVLIRPNHTRAEFMDKLKGGFVGPQPKLALELNRADPGGIGADQIGPPKPCAERRPGTLHDGPRRQSMILFADPASENVRAIGEPVRLTRFIAVDTTEAFTPADRFQVGGTSRVIRE